MNDARRTAPRTMHLRMGALAAVILVAAPLAPAQQPTSAQANAIRAVLPRRLPGELRGRAHGRPGGARVPAAERREGIAGVPAGVARRGGSASASAARGRRADTHRAAPAQARAPAPRPLPDTWPHTVTGENGTATIYQPQVIAWPEHRTLTARVAIGVTPNGAKAPLFGVVEVAFDTQTELAERTVVLTAAAARVREVPVGGRDAGRAVRSADPRGARRDGRQARAARERRAEPAGSRRRSRAEVALDNTPPRIFVSTRAASLVVFDGEPVMAPVAGHVAVRRRQHELGRVRRQRDAARGTCSSTAAGWPRPTRRGRGCRPVALPPSFAALPADANFAEREEADPRHVR